MNSDEFEYDSDTESEYSIFDENDRYALHGLNNSLGISDLVDVPNLFRVYSWLQNHYKQKKGQLRHGVSRQRNKLQPLHRQLNQESEKLKEKFGHSIDELQAKWNSGQMVRFRDKVSFVLGVSTSILTALLLGMAPEYIHIWYTIQLLIFLPLRYYTYHRKGYVYFIADFCYWGNVMLLAYIWIFPFSRRFFVLSYSVSYGTLAWSVVAWRNSLLFHSLDKITSLFIHFFPPLVLHTLVHLVNPSLLEERFPAIPNVPNIYLGSSLKIASISYALWQIWYYFFIQVGKRKEIQAGKPTSFTWMSKAYSKTTLGKALNALPENLRPFAFMVLQYLYSITTMCPCSIWYNNKVYSTAFLVVIFGWSVWNGASYYIDVFGMRFQRELEALRREIANDPSRSSPSSELDPENSNSSKVK
ncbi:glycerophosphocholine acyltransferase (GPCAT) Gpc1 [Schizosaccharomyces osmophilus]|uniref:Glycerophosphocholine acyltransferase 1 n=1 Tax=Schizosaccharomyces osmophilus TaxID=2545709 RepID=A0AAE9W9V8_9SCHI|nr:glycerophosphocholine acyltransferase (GPCAT) Gpc1 [Schizosaccharomyces osmophilus]WBW72255.1 glycerophosphocholine acyltransferase (GPCAT) Gpc1 [Schizosaccharomyces osmophilus]